MTRPTQGQTTVEVWSEEQRALDEFETDEPTAATPNTIDDDTTPAVLSRDVAAVIDTLEAAE